MTAPFLSVIIPAFNEEERIEATLEQIVAYLSSGAHSWEVIVADDGSTDNTAALVARRAQGEPRVCLVQAPHGGKGWALRHGMKQAQGEYLFLCDADLSMPIHHLTRFLPPALGEYDVAIGSREVPGARRFHEPRLRHFQGRVFNAIVRLVAVTGYTDTQCGFKCLRAEAVQPLLPLLRINGFAFDVELLFLARKQGLRIAEVPIDWFYRERSRVRFLIDAARMLGELLAIRWNALLGRYRKPSSPASETEASEEATQEAPSELRR